MNKEFNGLPWDDFPEKLNAAIPLTFCEDLARSRSSGFTHYAIVHQMIPEDNRSLAGNCTPSDVAEEFGVSHKSAKRRLTQLHEWGIIEKDESGNHTTYTIRSELLTEIDGPEQPTPRPPFGPKTNLRKHSHPTETQTTLHSIHTAPLHSNSTPLDDDKITTHRPSDPTESQPPRSTPESPATSPRSPSNQYAKPANTAQTLLTTLLTAGIAITGIGVPRVGLALLVISILPLAAWTVLTTVSHITETWTDPVDMQTPDLIPSHVYSSR